MPRVEREIVIHRPVQEVFDFMADGRNEPYYNPHMLRAEQTSAGPIGRGTRFRTEVTTRGRAMEMAYEITAYERPRRLASRLSKPLPVMDVQSTETFEPMPRGTRMRWLWEVEPRGVFTLMTPLLARMLGRRLDTVLASIKRLLEAEQTTRPCAQAVIRKPQEFTKMIGSRLGGKASRVGMLGTAALAAYLLLIRPRQLRWGATDEEVACVMPGDDLLPDPDLTATRGIIVRRRPADVWPWLAQLGQGRGGFYSYDVLENLVGCDIHSVNRVVPEWQEIRVGDQVRLHPEVGLAVVMADPGHALVLRGGVPMGRTRPPYDFIWAFALQGRPDGTTRLLVRERYRYTRWWAPLLVEPVEMISLVMSLKMMGGIRDRAERWSNAAEAAAGGG